MRFTDPRWELRAAAWLLVDLLFTKQSVNSFTYVEPEWRQSLTSSAPLPAAAATDKDSCSSSAQTCALCRRNDVELVTCDCAEDTETQFTLLLQIYLRSATSAVSRSRYEFFKSLEWSIKSRKVTRTASITRRRHLYGRYGVATYKNDRRWKA